jgi:hypothetical protein
MHPTPLSGDACTAPHSHLNAKAPEPATRRITNILIVTVLASVVAAIPTAQATADGEGRPTTT